MRVAFDANVIVAALLPQHAHHARAYIWLSAAKDGVIDGVMSPHAIAEAWAVLTRLPDLKVSGRDAAVMLEQTRSAISVSDADEAIYVEAVDRCIEANVTSGAIFDALHLAAARAAGADVMLTFNEKHFVRFSRDGDPKVVVPPDPPTLQGVL